MPVGGVFHAALLIGYTISFFLFRPHPAIMESRIIPAQTPTIAVNTKVQFPVLVNTLPENDRLYCCSKVCKAVQNPQPFQRILCHQHR